MIIIMNIIISLIGLGGIILARHFAWQGSGMGIKSHLFILTLKVIVSSIIIGLFLINTDRNYWILFILSGMTNIVVFHFIEAFVTQGKLINNRNVNV